MVVSYLVICETPDGSKYIQAGFRTEREAEQQKKKMAGYATNYYVVEYNPDSYDNSERDYTND